MNTDKKNNDNTNSTSKTFDLANGQRGFEANNGTVFVTDEKGAFRPLHGVTTRPIVVLKK